MIPTPADPTTTPSPQALALAGKQFRAIVLLLRATLQAATSDCPCSPCHTLRQNAAALDSWLQLLASGGGQP